MIKKILGITLTIFIIVFLYIWYQNLHKEGFDLEINNHTGQEITDLKIEYPGGPMTIQGIASESSIKELIKPSGNFGESEIMLIYKDKNGDEHRETIFGYIERGYSGTAKIKVISVDSQGIITFNIKADLRL